MNVLFRCNLDPILRLSLDGLLYLSRCSGGEHVVRNLDVFADDTTGRHERPLADNAAVEQHGVTTDQCVTLHVTVFHDSGVADGNVVVELCQMRNVDNGVVLNRGAGADSDGSVIAAKDGSEPDAGFLTDFNVADKDGGGGDECGRMHLGSLAPVSNDHLWNAYAMHRHNTPLRGVKATPKPAPGNPNYTEVNYRYAGVVGHIHEVVEIDGRQLAKVGFNDRKIVYYFLDDLELDQTAKRGTFHDHE